MSLHHLGLIFLLFVLSFSETLYEVLEIDSTASEFEIKKAFRKMSIKYHPDKNIGDQTAHKKYLEINRAFEVLSDSTKRVTYDNFGEQGLFDLQNRAKPKGGDYRTGMDVTLEDLYNGAQKVFSFRRGQLCKKCKGTGDATATLSTCSKCDGKGHLERKIKVNGINKVLGFKCPKCEGKGKTNKEICPVCQGKKITIEHRDLHFNVQPGRQLWQKQFFKGQSEQGVQFYPGDVILTLNMRNHKSFIRQHQHLYTNLTITLQESLLGFNKAIKHLDGRNLMITSQNPINNEEQIVLQGKGMPIKSDPGKFGNLYVKVFVDYNFNFNEKQKQLIRQIFASKGAQKINPSTDLQEQL